MSIVDKELERSLPLPLRSRFVDMIALASELESHCEAMSANRIPNDQWAAMNAYLKFKQERTK